MNSKLKELLIKLRVLKEKEPIREEPLYDDEWLTRYEELINLSSIRGLTVLEIEELDELREKSCAIYEALGLRLVVFECGLPFEIRIPQWIDEPMRRIEICWSKENNKSNLRN